MFHHLSGRLVLAEPSRAVIECGGVGYLARIPLTTYDKLPPPGEDAAARLSLFAAVVCIVAAVPAVLIGVIGSAADWQAYGVEAPEVREAAGKPAQGIVRLAARAEGDSVVIEIADDGAGIDPAMLRAAAVKKGALH